MSRSPHSVSKPIAVSFAAGLVAGALLFYRSRTSSTKKKIGNHLDDSEISFVELNDYEHTMLAVGTAPMATMTLLEGFETQEKQEAFRVLIKHRIQQILKANIWLTGHLAKRQGKYGIEYTSQSKEILISDDDIDKFFVWQMVKETDENPPMDPRLSNIYRICRQRGLVLSRMKEFQQTFWRVSIAFDAKSRKCSVFVSLSHVVGDGFTFYSLYNMLFGGEEIRALVVDRIASSPAQIEEVMGKDEKKIMNSFGFFSSMVRGVFLSKLIDPIRMPGSKRRFQVTSRYILVDPTKIEQMKTEQAGEEGGSFISTNDIITSWFFANSGANTGLMALNFRNRLPGHTNNHSGNYGNQLYYRLPEDGSNPWLIRKSIESFKRVVTSNDPIRPSGWDQFALITNWASFVCGDIDLVGTEAKQIVHLPLYDIVEVVPSTLVLCVIFQACPGQLALLLAGTDEVLERLSEAPFKSSEMFLLS